LAIQAVKKREATVISGLRRVSPVGGNMVNLSVHRFPSHLHDVDYFIIIAALQGERKG